MKCFNCGKELENDSKFCYSCGVKIEETEPSAVATEENAEKEKMVSVVSQKVEEAVKEISADGNKRKKITRILIGTLLILIGFQRILSAGTSISSTSFGADFYTYTYRGIVAISEILASIEVSLGWIIVAIGTMINMSASKK
ncbi:MAG: zinc ribbon domain-containing protein [Clostridia bacterium]|nr:zinc ribbon domain-containing protein [Clostridia bacterium]